MSCLESPEVFTTSTSLDLPDAFRGSSRDLPPEIEVSSSDLGSALASCLDLPDLVAVLFSLLEDADTLADHFD